MSDSPRFVEGETYTYEQIREFTFPAKGSHGIRTPDMRFVYHRDPETGSGFFDEVVEPEILLGRGKGPPDAASPLERILSVVEEVPSVIRERGLKWHSLISFDERRTTAVPASSSHACSFCCRPSRSFPQLRHPQGSQSRS